MTDRLTLSLWEEGQAHKAVSFLWKNAKEAVRDGKRMVAELRPETRSDAQNRHYHGLISQIAAHIGGDLAACLSKQWALAVCTLATAPGFWFLCMKEGEE